MRRLKREEQLYFETHYQRRKAKGFSLRNQHYVLLCRDFRHHNNFLLPSLALIYYLRRAKNDHPLEEH